MILKKETIERLNEKLILPYTGVEQDWDLEMANPERINDFLNYYQSHNLITDEKIAVMSLILASYDDFLNETDLEIDDRWSTIKKVLDTDKIIFTDLLNYWSPENDADEDSFRITKLIRKIKSSN